MEKINPNMVYDHENDDFQKAIGITEDELEDLSRKMAPILAGFTMDAYSLSQVTELLEKGFTEKERLFLSTMYVKSTAKMVTNIFNGIKKKK